MKYIKKFIVFSFIFILIFSLYGCAPSSSSSSTITTSKTYDTFCSEWTSPDGVHYWVGIDGSLTPRYDKMGNIVTD